MTKKKILIILVVVLAVGGFAAKTFLLPKPKAPVQKIAGTIYVLPKQFMINLQDGHYATLNVALVLAPGQSDGSSATGGTTDSGSTVGTLPEEAAIRDIVTNTVTGDTSGALISDGGREKIKRQILSTIKSQTDVKVDSVLLTDVAVQ